MSTFDERARYTDETLGKLTVALREHLGADADRILREDTCIYVVGSGGRGEMSARSDVDLFVARVGREASDIDALLVRQAIARALYALGLPDPSQAGAFLEMHTADTLCARLGTREDDATNTFTARMLLLLESRSLVGEGAYEKLIAHVVDAYWKDVDAHAADYHPFVLLNDVVRYWRSLLLNYVAKLAEKERELQGERRDTDRRLRSYKLRFSRCMTCFSVLARLLVDTARGAVSQSQVRVIVHEQPKARLERVAELAPEVASAVTGLLHQYESFLAHSSLPTRELIAAFQDPGFASERAHEGRVFGDHMFDLLQALGSTGRAKTLFRHIVV